MLNAEAQRARRIYGKGAKVGRWEGVLGRVAGTYSFSATMLSLCSASSPK